MCSILVFSYCPKETVAYVQATGVPIAVPVSCCQYVPANVKILFSITVDSISRNTSVGNCSVGSVYLFQ
jgi:hypothetical protein